MPDAAPPIQLAGAAGQSEDGPLTPERIERVLADFREWLTNPPAVEDAPAPAAEPVDLHTLVGQFTALRQEVNLQTKAARATLEQNASALGQLEAAVAQLQEPLDEEEGPSADLELLLKALVDVYDALALALRQVEKQRTAVNAALATVIESVAIEPPPGVVATEQKQGFWSRFFGDKPESAASPLAIWHERTIKKIQDRDRQVREAGDYLKDSLDGLLTGYTMSLNRIDRALQNFDVEPMQCVGKRFDPELMEVVEAVAAGDRTSGEVIEEVRRGYLLNGAVFRYAQVRVTR